MRIGVVGAAGRMGDHVLREALGRGHEVVGLVRREGQLETLPAGAVGVLGDATDLKAMAAFAEHVDVLVLATRSPEGSEAQTIAVANAALRTAKRADCRLMVIGGAAPLRTPSGKQVLDDPDFLPAAYRQVGLASMVQLQSCQEDAEADWVYLCPSAELHSGERTGTHRRGNKELLIDRDGRSHISMADLAAALVDELEHPRCQRDFFTAGAAW